MQNKTNKLKNMVTELAEYLAFMGELGITELDAALPDVTTSKKEVGPPGSPPITKLAEDRVSPDEIGNLLNRSRERVKTESGKNRVEKPRRDLLGSTKISELPVKPATNDPISAPRPNRPEITVKSVKEPTMPETNTAAATAENDTLESIRAEIGADCDRCELCEKRTQVVNSVGSHAADLMIIGEAPGADEDAQGEPFVGRAGKLLTKILEAIDFKREDVFIGNINRCRPPENRQPTLEESATCKPFLLREIEVVKPKVIVVLGNTATKNLLDTKTGITKLRGNFVERFGVKVMPTFHPAYLLRDPRKKREVWEDMKKVREYLNSERATNSGLKDSI